MHDSTFIIFVDQDEPKLSCKKSLLVIFKVLGVFLNIMIADEKYSPLTLGNLTQPIQMQVSKKQKTFSIFFCIFEI